MLGPIKYDIQGHSGKDQDPKPDCDLICHSDPDRKTPAQIT